LINKNIFIQDASERANGTDRNPTIGKNMSVRMMQLKVDMNIVFKAIFG
jgi:hypothetical protein